MKIFLAIILAITMLISIMPTAFAAVDEETGAITYEFTPASHETNDVWMERRTEGVQAVFKDYQTTDSEGEWAYLGSTTAYHNAGGYYSYISGDSGLFTQMTVPADGWLAVKIYVPEDGVYEISGTASSNSGTSKQEMYILPWDGRSQR